LPLSKKHSQTQDDVNGDLVQDTPDFLLGALHPRILLAHEKLKIRRVEWIKGEINPYEIIDDLIDKLNEIYDQLNNKEIQKCRIFHDSVNYTIIFYDSKKDILLTGIIPHDSLKEPGSFRVWRQRTMDFESDTNNQAGLRPRWAEESRPKKQVKLRLEPDLISELDSAAASQGMTRNDWIEESIRSKLAANKPKPK
jgi:predicted DNA binding CopG/RHH family protein